MPKQSVMKCPHCGNLMTAFTIKQAQYKTCPSMQPDETQCNKLLSEYEPATIMVNL